MRLVYRLLWMAIGEVYLVAGRGYCLLTRLIVSVEWRKEWNEVSLPSMIPGLALLIPGVALLEIQIWSWWNSKQKWMRTRMLLVFVALAVLLGWYSLWYTCVIQGKLNA